jgi:uncharacterized protein YkwD
LPNAVLGPNAEAVERAIATAARDSGVEMRGDGRLATLAAWTAERLGDGGSPPPHEIVEFFSRHLGLVEPVPHLLILGQPDPAVLEDGVADSVRQFLARQPYNRYGAAVIERQGLTLAVVTLSWRWLEMEPIARRIERGASLRFRGRLLGSYSQPTVAVARPNGAVRRLPAGEGPAFDIARPTDEQGVYKVELLAEGPRGHTVIANFPVYVGVAIPETVSLAAAEEGETEPDLVGQSLLRLINASREQAGLPSLVDHAVLGQVAEAHSREMVENRFVGHTSPATGTAAARVERAGIRSGLVLENIGRGYSAAEIHRGLLESPGHRANILNPDVSHVGVGVVAEQEGERAAFVATQVFVHMAAAIDVDGAPARLLEAINRARRARRAPPLELEPNLADAARAGATQFFAEPTLSQQDVVDEASGGLRGMGIAFSRVGGVMSVVGRLDEASRLEPTFDPDARFVGIGIAQGTRPDTGPNSIAVVILLAWPR